jgi:hypothetical protein
MGIWGRSRPEESAVNTERFEAALAKEYFYGQHEPRNQFEGGFVLQKYKWNWATQKSYSDKAEAIYANSIAKACVMLRALSIGNIDIKIEGGNGKTEKLLTRPNYRDGDLQTFLKNGEINLSIGGDKYIFWDNRLPSEPMAHTFRPDLVENDVKNSRFLYKPSDKEPAEFVFEYDHLGRTKRALQRSGSSYRAIQGGLQHIAYYDPRTSTEGAGAGDSALKAIEIMNAIDSMLFRKFNAGGTKAGYFQIMGEPTDADVAKIRAFTAALNPDGNTAVLPAGMEFKDAQLTLAEMEVLEAWQQQKQAICTAFQVPVELLSDSGATYANTRGMDKIFYRNFIGPEAHWLVGQLQTGLNLYIDPNVKLSVDETSVQHLEEDRLERASKMAQMKCFTADEIRASIGYDPAPEGTEFVGASVNMGQPEEKPKGEVAFNADAGNRGDNNDK